MIYEYTVAAVKKRIQIATRLLSSSSAQQNQINSTFLPLLEEIRSRIYAYTFSEAAVLRVCNAISWSDLFTCCDPSLIDRTFVSLKYLLIKGGDDLSRMSQRALAQDLRSRFD